MTEALPTAALFGLALLGVGLLLLATHAASVQSSPFAAGARAYPNAPALHPPQLAPLLLIVVVGEDKASEYRSYLDSEALLRDRLGEQPRVAEVVQATSESDAVALAAAVNDQATIPGVIPMSAVVVLR